MNEMNVTHKKLSKDVLRRLGTFVLALCMALSLLPSVLPPADAAFSDAAMDKLLNWGVVNGYPDGALHPDWSLTRAEFVAMVNRAYGYDELGATPFIDVPDNAWFHDDINIAYNARYFTGVSPRMAAPDTKLTREQAVVLLARNMRLEPIDGEAVEFSDGRDFSDWSRGYARAAKEAGVIGGYSDGSYKPKNSITRGEMAVMLQRALGTLINKPGTHTLSDVYGNVTINTPNVLLKDSTIVGDLYITGGLSLGDVTLQNVRVLGKIVVAGGGESESGESVILRNVQADALIVDSIVGQYVSLASEGDTLINEAILRTSAYVQDRTRPGEGLIQITLASLEAAAAFTLSGNLETVVNKTPNSTLKIAMGTVARLTVDEAARSSALNLDINSTVEELNLDTAAAVTGVGDIGDLFVNAPGADVEMLPDKVTIRPGLTATVGGQSMNARQAQESSSDPRLLASYPKVKNIAPTNATSVYSANKGGTVFWAVSDTTDGSIGEEDLIEPTDENARIVLSGTTAVEQSNTEYTAALQPLTPDTNYYLSTVMTDARGRRSPVKVASFATPDNTVPAFAQGYPTVMKNYCVSITDQNGVVQRDEDGFPRRNYRVQVAAMPNKNCVLYYALYPAGSTAPTAQQFRTGALGSPIRSGMEDASKNRINFIELTGLEQLTNYDIYLCYIDADGSRNSPVQKLTFRTVDGKPPRFLYDTPVVTQEQLTSLRLSVSVDEAATIYWVASRGEYVNDGDWDDVEWWERACRQIESGINSVSSGSVTARANTDTVLTVNGLQPATRYYITFVAKDAAGNYSEFFRLVNAGSEYDEKHPEQYTPHNEQPYKYYLRASTLDNIPPEAWQEFTSYDATDPNHPYADTDIIIHFSEAVMQYSTNASASQDRFRDFDTLYKALVSAREELKRAQSGGNQEEIKAREDDVTIAETAFVNALRATIQLYNNASSSNSSVAERNSGNEATIGSDWVIDYRYATVQVDADTGEMTVTFPTVTEDPDDPNSPKSALNLASGATYHFVLNDICDTSSNKNRMGRYPLPDFTTISAQVKIAWFDPSYVYYNNYYSTGADVTPQRERVTIDAAFSLTPLSTSVEDNVVWDLILWTDASCRMEIYELEAPETGSNLIGADAVLIRPLDSSGRFSATENGHYDVDFNAANLGNSNPDPAVDDYAGYRGVSYFANFYGVNLQSSPSDGFPSVTGEGALLDRYTPGMDLAATQDINPRGVLERLKPKYYGIHFTEIDRSPEKDGGREAWNASFNLRASVVTAPLNNSLRILSQGIDASSLNTFLTQNGGSEIQVDQPSYTPIQFTSGVAPAFASNYPQFAPDDTFVDMRLTLANNRLGTVYYVIAPASRWYSNSTTGLSERRYEKAIDDTRAYDGTTIAGVELQYPDDANGLYERYYAMLGGEIRYVPLGGDDDKVDDTTFLLARPTNYDIYSPGYTNPRIKTGFVEITDTSLTEISIDGLEAETVYFVYLVTKGTGGTDYAEYAQLFQFTTKPLNPPRLTVSQPRLDQATISTDKANTVVYAALYPSHLLPNLDVFKDPFFYEADGATTSGYINPDREQYMSDLAGLKDTAGREYLSYTVWEAIRAQIPAGLNLASGGSLFDFFASERVKDQIADLIKSLDENAQGSQGLGSRTISPGDNWTPELTLEDGFSYVLFAVGGLEGASGHSLSFGAAGLLSKLDDSKPTIQSISGSMTVDYKNAPAGNDFIMYGYIELEFEKDLYLRNPRGDTGLPEINELTSGDLTSFITSNEDQFPRVVPVPTNATSPISTVRIYTKVQVDNGILDYTQFTVNPQLCTASGILRGSSLQIQLHYDPDVNKVYATVLLDGAEWYPRGNGVAEIQMSPGAPILPDATSWMLNTTYLDLTIGGSGQIETRTVPARANGTFTYSSSDGSVAAVDASGVVTGLKEGTATITVRFFVNGTEMYPLGWTTAGEVTVYVGAEGSIAVNPRTVTLQPSNNYTVTVSVVVTASDRMNKALGYRFNTAGYYGGDGNGNNTKEKLILDQFQQLGDTTVYQITLNPDYELTSRESTIIITFYLRDYPSITDSVSVSITVPQP